MGASRGSVISTKESSCVSVTEAWHLTNTYVFSGYSAVWHQFSEEQYRGEKHFKVPHHLEKIRKETVYCALKDLMF